MSCSHICDWWVKRCTTQPNVVFKVNSCRLIMKLHKWKPLDCDYINGSWKLLCTKASAGHTFKAHISDCCILFFFIVVQINLAKCSQRRITLVALEITYMIYGEFSASFVATIISLVDFSFTSVLKVVFAFTNDIGSIGCDHWTVFTEAFIPCLPLAWPPRAAKADWNTGLLANVTPCLLHAIQTFLHDENWEFVEHFMDASLWFTHKRCA